jgi:hypothetical protein
LIDTTDGVTSEAILFTSDVGEPRVNAVRFEEQPFDPAKYIAWLRLSTHTLIPSGSDVEAVAIPPATEAPAMNAAMILIDDFFISSSPKTWQSFHDKLRESLKTTYYLVQLKPGLPNHP